MKGNRSVLAASKFLPFLSLKGITFVFDFLFLFGTAFFFDVAVFWGDVVDCEPFGLRFMAKQNDRRPR